METQGKVWGHTVRLLTRNNVEFHRIEIKPGGYSSKHCHIYKYNAFFVEVGTLEISVWKKNYDLVDKTILHAGGLAIIPPGEYHAFKAKTCCVAYEIYWVELNSDDIIRDGCGGIEKENSHAVSE